MKKIKICTVVTGNSLKDFLQNLKKIQAVSDMVELRVDYIKNLSIKDLEIIKYNLDKQAIFTCRKKSEGGRFFIDENKRINIIKKAIDLKFDYIDIEKTSISKIKIYNNKSKSKIIISWHDFEKTPDLKKLLDIKKQMILSNANIIKIVTKVNDNNDIKNLIQLLLSKGRENLIILGMGHKGKILRVMSPLLGGYLTFASAGSSKSAAGQIDITNMKKIYNIIN